MSTFLPTCFALVESNCLYLQAFIPSTACKQLKHHAHPAAYMHVLKDFRSHSCFQLLRWAAESHGGTMTATTPI